jgi:hypothetical protein
MKLESLVDGCGAKRVLSYKHGYLWIGDDPSGYCFGTLDEKKTLRMAKAILNRAALDALKEG